MSPACISTVAPVALVYNSGDGGGGDLNTMRVLEGGGE